MLFINEWRKVRLPKLSWRWSWPKQCKNTSVVLLCMKMVTSKTGIETSQRCSMHYNEGGLSTLSWRTVTVTMINSQLILKLCRMCCSSWISLNLWGLMGFIRESSKSLLMPLQSLSWWFLSGFGNLEGYPSWWEAGNVVPVFKKGRKEDLCKHRCV